MGVEEDPQPDGAELVVWIAQNAERLQNEITELLQSIDRADGLYRRQVPLALDGYDAAIEELRDTRSALRHATYAVGIDAHFLLDLVTGLAPLGDTKLNVADEIAAYLGGVTRTE